MPGGQKGSSVAPSAAPSAARPTGAKRRASSRGPVAASGARLRAGSRLARRVLPNRIPEIGGERRSTGSPLGIRRKRTIDRGDEPARKIAALGEERRRPGFDRACDFLERNAPERVSSRERLPEQDADSPDVALRRRLGPRKPLRSDVRESSRHVADRRQRVCAVELGEPEVQQADGDLVALLEQEIGGLDVAMDDSGPVRVGEGVEHLGGDLDRILVREAVRAHRLAQGAPGHVLVRDVDVARIVSDVVSAHTSFVAQPARRQSFTLGAGGGLSFAGDDLQRDVEARALVAGEPDGARAAASQRTDRPIATEDELVGGGGDRDGRHG